MKITYLIALFFVVLQAGYSCKKKKDTSPNPNKTSSDSFTLKKDGVYYSAGKINATSSETSEYIGILAHLSALQENEETYSMSLNKHVQPGTYDEVNSPNSLSDICAFIHIHNQLQVFFMDDGEITILSNDTVAKKIEFNFKLNLNEDLGTGVVHITEGHCKVDY